MLVVPVPVSVSASESWVWHFQMSGNAVAAALEAVLFMRSLDELRIGESGQIVKISYAGPVTRRILDLGMVKGASVEVVKVAPLGDPIEIKVRGCNISLRRREAATILVDEPVGTGGVVSG